MKKRIISGLTALAMVLLQVPVLVTTTLADTLSMEQAYFQVLDDIVREYGVCDKEYTGEDFTGNPDDYYPSGLAYAELLDFDHNGTEELLLTYTYRGNHRKTFLSQVELETFHGYGKQYCFDFWTFLVLFPEWRK